MKCRKCEVDTKYDFKDGFFWCSKCDCLTHKSYLEDNIVYFPNPCEKCDEYIHINDQMHRFKCDNPPKVVKKE